MFALEVGVVRVFALISLLYVFGSQGLPAVQKFPAEISDKEFWRIVTEFSEKDGFFDSDNFVSNEGAFQSVIPRLVETAKSGGVFIGVGPEQNFTYIAAVQPKLSFIVDIR